MSTSSVALAGRHRRKSSGKAVSHTLFGGAAVACLVIGCSWTVYSNIINASAYPTIGTADHVEAVARRPKMAERSTVQVIHETFAALPEQPASDRDLDQRRDLLTALASLPKGQRAVVVLRYFEDLTEAQTAELLGCSVGTVKSQCSKALAKLRIDPALTEAEGDPR